MGLQGLVNQAYEQVENLNATIKALSNLGASVSISIDPGVPRYSFEIARGGPFRGCPAVAIDDIAMVTRLSKT